MRIGMIGGTGKEGRGLAYRWARAGHDVAIGSRDPERARAAAEEMTKELGLAAAPSDGKGDVQSQGRGAGKISGGDNEWAARSSELSLLSVPYAAHGETLRGLVAALAGKILIDITVPLRPPKVDRVALPPGQAAALEAQAILGDAVKVVGALHHVGAAHLSDLSHAIDCDVLVCGDDAKAKDVVMALIQDLGLRALDAGALQNAVALESLTPVLIHLNKKYKSPGAGIRFTHLPGMD